MKRTKIEHGAKEWAGFLFAAGGVAMLLIPGALCIWGILEGGLIGLALGSIVMVVIILGLVFGFWGYRLDTKEFRNK